MEEQRPAGGAERQVAKLEDDEIGVSEPGRDLARSTRDLLNILDAVANARAGFCSLADVWAETTTPHGRLMLTVLGGLAEFERDLIRTRTGKVERAPRRAGFIWVDRQSSLLIKSARP
jgi:DNA invertase Pin-like site-specific DNA recombinase